MNRGRDQRARKVIGLNHPDCVGIVPNPLKTKPKKQGGSEKGPRAEGTPRQNWNSSEAETEMVGLNHGRFWQHVSIGSGRTKSHLAGNVGVFNAFQDENNGDLTCSGPYCRAVGLSATSESGHWVTLRSLSRSECRGILSERIPTEQIHGTKIQSPLKFSAYICGTMRTAVKVGQIQIQAAIALFRILHDPEDEWAGVKRDGARRSCGRRQSRP
ncbi:hypothetical protein DFH08DRAFT_822606 [Mycena albidolilacea]|uniref:Uncharacterized protein n=1 Tax=Mycena albidolilacea TaxID=1033008 RepID=A0AAD7ECV2_9AGAR|nr:hypothetical protein DFH08DRAFT_822606 [Mycena albidolilacea]